MTTNSSTCKLEDKKEKKKEDRFNFWIYVSLIILVILLLSIFIYIIYSLLNSKNNTSNYSYQSSVYKATPPPPPVMNITPPVIKTQPSFISSIFPKASSTTTLINSTDNFKTPEIKKEVNSIISPLFTRQIIPPINKQMGGYIKLFKRF